jgi:hypothetical protein
VKNVISRFSDRYPCLLNIMRYEISDVKKESLIQVAVFLTQAYSGRPPSLLCSGYCNFTRPNKGTFLSTVSKQTSIGMKLNSLCTIRTRRSKLATVRGSEAVQYSALSHNLLPRDPFEYYRPAYLFVFKAAAFEQIFQLKLCPHCFLEATSTSR